MSVLTPQGGSGGELTLLQELEKKAKEKVDKKDYNAQIDRWNEYQNILGKVELKTLKHRNVTLRKNIKHNMKEFTETSLALIIMFGVPGFVCLGVGLYHLNTIMFEISHGIANQPGIYFLSVGIVISTIIIKETLERIPMFAPSTLKFRCAPKLHIDEMAYARKKIRDIPAVEHDPIVRLPVLEMSIPRKWIGQQGTLEFMESLGDIKL